MTEDTRNVIDKYKGWEHEDIVADLDSHGVELHIAIENTQRDFNMGTIVRSANAFGIRHIHVVGRRQWNKRGAMATDKYLHVHYHATVEEFATAMKTDSREIVVIDNIPGSKLLSEAQIRDRQVIVFGQEGPGISPEMVQVAAQIVEIKQRGSTRSLNVGVAAGIVMYEWTRGSCSDT